MSEVVDGIGCDPNCVWRDAISELLVARQQELDGLPRDESMPVDSLGRHPLTQDSSKRKKDGGYTKLGDIEINYRGLGVLDALSRRACVEACMVEDYVDDRLPDDLLDSEPEGVFGRKVLDEVIRIKGE